jgi:hypothetical protein
LGKGNATPRLGRHGLKARRFAFKLLTLPDSISRVIHDEDQPQGEVDKVTDDLKTE